MIFGKIVGGERFILVLSDNILSKNKINTDFLIPLSRNKHLLILVTLILFQVFQDSFEFLFLPYRVEAHVFFQLFPIGKSLLDSLP